MFFLTLFSFSSSFLLPLSYFHSRGAICMAFEITVFNCSCKDFWTKKFCRTMTVTYLIWRSNRQLLFLRAIVCVILYVVSVLSAYTSDFTYHHKIFKRVQAEWLKIPSEVFANFVNTMQKVMSLNRNAVLRRKKNNFWSCY